MDDTSAAPLSYQTTQTAGPAFSSSRVLRFGDMTPDEQEAFTRFFAEQKVAFFRDLDGSYVANVRLYDPAVIDMAASQRAKQKEEAKTLSSRKAAQADDLSRMMADMAQGSGANALDYSVYSRFLPFIAPRDSIKPKARPLAWLMRQVEEMYDQRYAKDTADLRGEVEGEEGNGGPTPFPNFVYEFFSKRYGLRSLVDQNCWDMLYNLHTLRKEYQEVETFARFLEEYYDADDLLFFLYVRSVIQKESDVSFKTRWSELGRGAAQAPESAGTGMPAPLYLTARECQLVARVVFGSEADPLYRTFISMVERNLTGQRKGKTDTRKIDCTHFLHLALVEYHETRPADERELAALGVSQTKDTEANLGKLFNEVGLSNDGAEDHGPAPSSSAPASPSNSAQVARLYDALGEAINRSSQAYLDRVLEGVAGLPKEVQDQIRDEVRTQLENKVDAVLGALLNAQRSGGRMGSPTADSVLDNLSEQITSASRGLPEDNGSINRLADSIIRLPDVQDTVTPLVSLLVTYATTRLQEGPRRA